MSEDKKTQYGIIVSGMIMSKNHFPGSPATSTAPVKKDRFSFDVAVPGNREIMSISIAPEKWGALPDSGDWRGRVTFRTYKGVAYFEAVS